MDRLWQTKLHNNLVLLKPSTHILGQPVSKSKRDLPPLVREAGVSMMQRTTDEFARISKL